MPIQMESFKLIRQSEEVVKEALNSGEIDHILGTQLSVADGYVLCSMKDGFLDEWLSTFPDPRQEKEISEKVILTGSLAAAFHGFLSESGVAFALRSRSLLEELGYGVEVLEPGNGISRRGTQQELAFTPDAIRKYLDQQRKSEPRRDMSGDEHPEDVQVGYSFIQWYNECVGPSFRNRYKKVVHSFDGTKFVVCFENDHYEGSGILKEEDGSLVRGYKGGFLKSYLDNADVLTGVELGPVQRHDIILAKRLLLTTPVLKPGDLLIYDRGLIDSELLNELKIKREVDVIVPIRSNMEVLREAVSLANMAEEQAQRQGKTIWQDHPWIEGQQITLVENLKDAWEGCQVDINGALVRWKKEDQSFEYLLFICTALKLTAAQILLTYKLRVEIEEDNKQVKCSWEGSHFSTTNLTYIVFHIVITLAAYSLFAYYNGTKAGRRFSQKTIQQAKREEGDPKNIRIILVARGCFVILRPIEFAWWLLHVSEAPKQKLKETIEPWVKDTSDLWPFEFR